MITVYADVLVALNILITYLILVSVRLVCRFATNKWGVAIASVLGGLSSLIIFCESMSVAWSVIYKLFIASVITAVAFLPGNIRVFLKTFLSFFGISFLFGGVMYAVEITFKPQNILYLNGTVYFNMSITYLVGSVLVIYGVFVIADYFLSKKLGSNEIYKVKITFRNTSTEISGLLDTGNNLKDGMTGRPVIVAELSAVAPLFSFEEVGFFKRGDFTLVPESLKTKVHLIPCNTVAGESLLPCVIPEKVEYKIKNKKAQTDFVSLAICNKSLSSGEYKALLNSSISDLGWKENKDEIFVD